MTDDWMTDEHKKAALMGAFDLARSVVENAPTEILLLELRRRECAQSGHDFDVVVEAGEPVGVTCPCGAAWGVKPVETSTAADPGGCGG